jgi:hypothetical protein
MMLTRKADAIYRVLQAMSSADGQTVSATGNYTTKALPSQIPVVDVSIDDTSRSS